jgi:hypothetical protein
MILVFGCGLSTFLVVFAVYLIAHSIGYNRGVTEGRRQIAEDRYGLEMASFWTRQEWFKQEGYPYMNSDMEIVYPDV